ncbi:hypothetical protein J7K70_01965 [bacterium]|nr:hypothetical protein [bacterium]
MAKKIKFKRQNRKNGFYCPLLTRKGNCAVTGKICIGIRLKTNSLSPKELKKLPDYILDCSGRLVTNGFFDEAPEVLDTLGLLIEGLGGE